RQKPNQATTNNRSLIFIDQQRPSGKLFVSIGTHKHPKGFALVVHVGLNDGAEAIILEQQAYKNPYVRLDASGQQCECAEHCAQNGGTVLHCGLNLTRTLDQLKKLGFRAELSFHEDCIAGFITNVYICITLVVPLLMASLIVCQPTFHSGIPSYILITLNSVQFIHLFVTF
ncbi:unnamed protein product, partial [Echinostoma caproni]|uniref:Nitro_FeMo-Co domain-containing protein n=1 Tax=Echinostoma caproni TaxID=27848 RepID=A0A183B2C0_9TREM